MKNTTSFVATDAFLRRAIAALAIMLATSAILVTAAAPDHNASLKSLADIEREFAAYSVEHGMFKAFVKYFAPNGVNFTPDPTITVNELADEAAGPKPPFELDWYPVYSDVSQAGDLGMNTGPTRVVDPNEPAPRHSYFFSIWQKQPDGQWRVVVDHGVRHPEPTGDWKAVPWVGAKASAYKGGGKLSADDIKKLEADFSAAVNAKGMAGAYPVVLDEGARLHYSGSAVAIARADMEKHWAESDGKGKWSWSAMDAGVSSSADFAWSYGKFNVMKSGGAEPAFKGYYTHIWKRNAAGDWKLAYEVIRQAPPAKPQQ